VSVIRWEDPPEDRRGTDWAAVGQALKQQPGKWALAVVCNNTVTAGAVARDIRVGKYPAMRALGSFDAMARSVDGEARVYARYVGGDES
jgi:hypothetical protein